MTERIGKPWAVYELAPLIIKIVQDGKEKLSVRDSETKEHPLMFLNLDNVQRFDTSYEAIEYFCKTYRDYQEKVIPRFLSNFPTERTNLEKLLAQRQAKCTKPLLIIPKGIWNNEPESYVEPDGPGIPRPELPEQDK